MDSQCCICYDTLSPANCIFTYCGCTAVYCKNCIENANIHRKNGYECCICRKEIIVSSSFTKHCEVLRDIVKNKLVMSEESCIEYRRKVKLWKGECEKLLTEREQLSEENDSANKKIVFLDETIVELRDELKQISNKIRKLKKRNRDLKLDVESAKFENTIETSLFKKNSEFTKVELIDDSKIVYDGEDSSCE